MIDSIDNYDAVSDIIAGIAAVKYEKSFFSVDEMVEYKSVYVIHKTGIIERLAYKGKSKRILSKKSLTVSPDVVIAYYRDIINCIKSAVRVSDFVDDCDAQTTICYYGGEIVLPRGLESETDVISFLSESFLKSAGF